MQIIKKNFQFHPELQNKFESLLNQVENIDLLSDGFVNRYNQILFTENSSKISKTISGDELAKSDIDGKLFFDDFPLEEILDNEDSYKSLKKLSTMVNTFKNENFENSTYKNDNEICKIYLLKHQILKQQTLMQGELQNFNHLNGLFLKNHFNISWK